MEDEEEHPEEVALLDYVVGDLAPDSSDAIRQHVERCADCRERIVDLAMEMDEIDRLPTVAIPHDVLRGVFPAAPRRGRALLPVLALLAVGCGIFALFQIGGLRGDQPLTPQRQVILRTDVALPEQLVADALGDVPSRITVDRDDDRHLVVLVSDADLGIAYDRLAAIADGTGRSYIVDVGGAGVLPGSAP